MNQATLRTYFRVTSVAVWLVALAFALNFCLGQLFPDARAQIWLVMDPLMGASIIVSPNPPNGVAWALEGDMPGMERSWSRRISGGWRR